MVVHKALVSSNMAKKSSMVNYSETGRESDDVMSNKKGKKVTRIHEEMLIKITNNKSLSNPNVKQYQTSKYFHNEPYTINIYLTLE